MTLPFRRLPFELAEPGTDPTRIPTSAGGRRRLNLGNYSLILVVVAFLGFGYFRFIYKPAERPRPTATAATPATNEPNQFAQGFFRSATATPAATATPTATATATTAPDGVVYAVFVGGLMEQTQITCTCYPGGAIDGPEECNANPPTACQGDPGDP